MMILQAIIISYCNNSPPVSIIASMYLYALKTVFVMVVTDKLAASKKEQQHLQSSLEQWQRMGRARDQHMLKFKNENEVLQSKCTY